MRRKNEKVSGYTVIYQDVSDRKYFESLATRDELTGLYNRRFYNEVAPVVLNRARREQNVFVFFLLDVDNFKNINDVHGHDIGDEALISLGNIIKEHIRETDVFARWGGEEFMLLVETDVNTASKLAENLRLSIAKYTKKNTKIPAFTCSFGVQSLEGILSLEEA
mgnify:CR=1 FL=1